MFSLFKSVQNLYQLYHWAFEKLRHLVFLWNHWVFNQIKKTHFEKLYHLGFWKSFWKAVSLVPCEPKLKGLKSPLGRHHPVKLNHSIAAIYRVCRGQVAATVSVKFLYLAPKIWHPFNAIESPLNWISFSGFKRSPYLYFWLKTFPRLIFPFPGLYFLAAMIAPFIFPQSQWDDHCMHIFTPNPTHQFKSSSVPNTKYQPHFPFSSYYTVLAIQTLCELQFEYFSKLSFCFCYNCFVAAAQNI